MMTRTKWNISIVWIRVPILWTVKEIMILEWIRLKIAIGLLFIYLFIYSERPLRCIRFHFSGFCVDKGQLRSSWSSSIWRTHSVLGLKLPAQVTLDTPAYHLLQEDVSGYPQTPGHFTGLKYLLLDVGLVVFSSSYLTGYQLRPDMPFEM